MKTFELHTFTNGQWVFNSVYEDTESAKTEAKRLKEKGTHAALSITEEIFDETTETTSSRTVFTMGDTGARDKTGWTKARAGPSRGARPAGPGTRHIRGRNRRRGGKAPGLVLPIFLLLSLLVAGAGALYGLQLML
jgi:hypothetical protein